MNVDGAGVTRWELVAFGFAALGLFLTLLGWWFERPAARRARRERRLMHSRGLMWTCHFCGEWREDRHIAVVSSTRFVGRVPIKHTRRYCRDRNECKNRAYEWAATVDAFGRS